ncbi:hypothetical protein Tco_0284191, partial [Tanacetum coccineum]
KRDPGSRQRKVQISSSNDNTGGKKGMLANSVNSTKRKDVAFDQRVEARQWKRPSKGGKERRSRRKRQATGNLDGIDDMKDNQTKDHLNILSGDNDLVPTLRGRRWNGRAYGYLS